MRPTLVAAALVVSACRPDTTRPSFTPLPEAASTEIRLPAQDATARLAEALQADSLPPSRVRIRDGYIETRWLDSATGRPSRARPTGTGVIRLHAWADPGRPGFTVLTVETVYRPVADPSLPGRDLDRQVPRDHPVALKVERILESMVKRYGGPPRTEPQGRDAAPPEEPADEQQNEEE